MTSEDYSEKNMELVQQLIGATQQGRVSWQPTANLNEFTTSFKGRFSVLIGQESEGGTHYLRMLNEEGRELLYLRQFVGRPLRNISIIPKEQQNALLGDLFELARRSALRVDNAIDEVLETLKHA